MIREAKWNEAFATEIPSVKLSDFCWFESQI